MTLSATPPSPLPDDPAALGERLETPHVAIPEDFFHQLEDHGVEVDRGQRARAEHARDWWPLTLGWLEHGAIPARPAAVALPKSTAEVARVVRVCNRAGVPLTAMGGRSGVCGGAVPLFGGIALDLTQLAGVDDIDTQSLLADVKAGTFGPDLEAALRGHSRGFTLGHWPQSMDLSTVGGWLACRSAGQYSTRYGKIEDMVVGLEVVLADGSVITTDGNGPRAATGPNLTQLFVGSEGTLGIITQARLRIHPVPQAEARAAFGFPTFDAGLDVCRRILRRGATPAVLRLYDEIESERNFSHKPSCVLIVLDEGDRRLVEATMAIVEKECLPTSTLDIDEAGGEGGNEVLRLDDALVERWLNHRNDVSALVPLWKGGIVVDTAEVAGRWSTLPTLTAEVLKAIRALDGTLVASVHESHAYSDGACLYFTFAGRNHEDGQPDNGRWAEDYYVKAWDALTTCVTTHDAVISHHHGIGLNRARLMREALGPAFGVLQQIKEALDPSDILNPGKLGLTSGRGPVPWP